MSTANQDPPVESDLEIFRRLHKQFSNDAERPFPSIIVHSWSERLSVYGLNGDDIVHENVRELETMQAATGYPVYYEHKELLPAIEYNSYHTQPQGLLKVRE